MSRIYRSSKLAGSRSSSYEMHHWSSAPPPPPPQKEGVELARLGAAEILWREAATAMAKEKKDVETTTPDKYYLKKHYTAFYISHRQFTICISYRQCTIFQSHLSIGNTPFDKSCFL